MAEMAGGVHPTTGHECGAGGRRRFCCPVSSMPLCWWHNSGRGSFCRGTCAGNLVKVGASSEGINYHVQEFTRNVQALWLTRSSLDCQTGSVALCCTNNVATRPMAQCQWAGNTPDCGRPASCPVGTTRVVSSDVGNGGEEPCLTGQRSLCCENNPWTNCAWTQGNACPLGKTNLAIRRRLSGYSMGRPQSIPGSIYCCDIPAEALDITSIREFDVLISGYLAHPQCPASRVNTKRSIIPEGHMEGITPASHSHSSIEKRQGGVGAYGMALSHDLQAIMTDSFSPFLASRLRSMWNTRAAPRLGGATIEWLEQSIQNDLKYNPMGVALRDKLCLGTEMVQVVENGRATMRRMCTTLVPNTKRSVDDAGLPERNGSDPDFDKRNFDTNFSEGFSNANGIPVTIGTFMANVRK